MNEPGRACEESVTGCCFAALKALFISWRIFDRSHELERLSKDVTEAPSFRAQAAKHRHPRNVRTVPKSRDFH